MRIFLVLLILFPLTAYGQITKPGVQAENGGTILGRALTVNCDNNCIVCSLSGTTLTISLSSSCSGGSSGGNVVTVLGQLMMVNGNIVQILGQ